MQILIYFLKNKYSIYKSFINYISISVFVTLIDILVCRISENFIGIIASNTFGILTGFVIQYILTAKYVFYHKSFRSFLVFFFTLVVGLILANTIVYVSRNFIFGNSDSMIAFLVSKGLSTVIPFFLTYYLRKVLIKKVSG